LDHALDVLTSGQRDVPERHQTLRATIAWSHSLLSDSEQRLFRRMAAFVDGCTVVDVEAVCAEAGESCLDELESLVDKALVQVDGRGDRLSMLQTIGEFAREQLELANEAGAIALRHASRFAHRARQIRDGIEGTQQVSSVEAGMVEEGNLHAAIGTLLVAARSGDEIAAELGMQMSGDLWMYWHLRGKNVTARQYATAFLEADARRAATHGRAGALITAGLASWMLGRYEQSLDECAQAHRIAAEIGAQREICIAGLMQALALIFVDPEAGLRCAEESIETSRTVGFTWAEGITLTVAGILHAATTSPDVARARYGQALEIQRRLGDWEGAGMSLGGLAELASARGETSDAVELYRQSLAAFEAVGDRGEEARILSELAWTHLADGEPTQARATFFESVQAHLDLASVRGVGLSLVGLAATEVAEQRPENALRIAAAAEVYAHEEGIAVIYTEDTPGREFIDQAVAALPPDAVTRVTEAGRKLTIKEALDLARTPQPAAADLVKGDDRSRPAAGR
jgi:tetratricopeptide (TPR) repeat protein